MRYAEITSGMRVPVDLEEQNVLDKIGPDALILDDLDEREAEVARLMVTKGLLKQFINDGKPYVVVSRAADIWRI